MSKAPPSRREKAQDVRATLEVAFWAAREGLRVAWQAGLTWYGLWLLFSGQVETHAERVLERLGIWLGQL